VYRDGGAAITASSVGQSVRFGDLSTSAWSVTAHSVRDGAGDSLVMSWAQPAASPMVTDLTFVQKPTRGSGKTNAGFG